MFDVMSLTHDCRQRSASCQGFVHGFLSDRGCELVRSLTLDTKGNGMLCRTWVTLLVELRVRVWVPRAEDTCGPRQVEADPSC